MRIRILLLLAVTLFAAGSLPALADDCSLTLLYTGNNYGTLRPCPT